LTRYFEIGKIKGYINSYSLLSGQTAGDGGAQSYGSLEKYKESRAAEVTKSFCRIG
jgi:hypothetical protein